MVVTKRRGVIVIASIFLCAILTTVAIAQESRPRRLLLFFSFEDESLYTTVERRLLYDSLLFKLSDAEAPFR